MSYNYWSAVRTTLKRRQKPHGINYNTRGKPEGSRRTPCGPCSSTYALRHDNNITVAQKIGFHVHIIISNAIMKRHLDVII